MSADQQIDIVCLQDISAAHNTQLTKKEENSLNLQFKNCSAIHTKYASIISLNPSQDNKNYFTTDKHLCSTARQHST